MTSAHSASLDAPESTPYRGGPRTVEGKERSRANAVKHGLCATELLPTILPPGRLAQYIARFTEEHQPKTETQRTLVAELARHAAVLEFLQEAEGAVLRHGALSLTTILPVADGQIPTQRDAILSAAVSSEALDRCARYRRGHEKAFNTSLLRLREEMSGVNRPATQVSMTEFSTDAACAAYLKRRLLSGEYRCPRCGSNSGFYWLKNRSSRQCRRCRHQAGLRAGTVMAGSSVSLATWFLAIRLLLARPALSAKELGEQLGLRRPATARTLTRKIRSAVPSAAGSELLAGLDKLYSTSCQAET